MLTESLLEMGREDGWEVMIERIKMMIMSSLVNAQADHFHKIKTCLISKTRPNKAEHHSLVSRHVFCFVRGSYIITIVINVKKT